MINIDMQAVGDWAERRGIAYSGYQDLAAKPQVYELIRECVEKVNADLAADPKLCRQPDPPLRRPAQGARRGRRRAHAHAQGAPALHRREVRVGRDHALYSDTDHCWVEAQVRFEDGRTGTVRAQLAVREAKTFAPQAARKAA